MKQKRKVYSFLAETNNIHVQAGFSEEDARARLREEGVLGKLRCIRCVEEFRR